MAYTVLPRYALSYPTFKPKDKAPPFEPHLFGMRSRPRLGAPLQSSL
jgi:hypothetical protein